MIALAAQADVEIIAFAEAPAVTFQVSAEIQLRLLAFDTAPRGLRLVHFEFDLLRADGPFFLAEMGAEETRHRAEVPAGANDQSG
jgi:hypothetical protein